MQPDGMAARRHLAFVSASKSPTGKPLLIVSNETSSTTTVWQIEQ